MDSNANKYTEIHSSFQHYINVDLSKMKVTADDNSNVPQMMELVFVEDFSANQNYCRGFLNQSESFHLWFT